jgi:hypothetical protein
MQQGDGHRGQSRTSQISAGNELDRFSRPATRRARPGLPWVSIKRSMPGAETEKRVSRELSLFRSRSQSLDVA